MSHEGRFCLTHFGTRRTVLTVPFQVAWDAKDGSDCSISNGPGREGTILTALFQAISGCGRLRQTVRTGGHPVSHRTASMKFVQNFRR